jgi:hypothetical protein
MPTTVALHQISDLSHGESKDEIILETKLNTELHIIAKEDSTIIRLPFGNKFDIIDGIIIIHENH